MHSSVELCGCKARVAAAVLLPSHENLPENGVNPQRNGTRKWGAIIHDQSTILHPRSPPAWIFQLLRDKLYLCICQNFCKRCNSKWYSVFHCTAISKFFSFFCSVQNLSWFRPGSNASSSNKQTLLSWARRTLSLWIPRAFYKSICFDTSLTRLYSFFLRCIAYPPVGDWHHEGRAHVVITFLSHKAHNNKMFWTEWGLSSHKLKEQMNQWNELCLWASSALWEEASFASWEGENKPLLEMLPQSKLPNQEEVEEEAELDKEISQEEPALSTRKL